MKTISEMQDALNEASQLLLSVSRDLSEYTKQDEHKDNMDFLKLRFIGRQHPLNGHPLGQSAVQREYLTLLIAMLSIRSSSSEKGWDVIQRIALGGGYTETLEAIAADAVSLKEEAVLKFTQRIVDAKLEKMFVLDSLIIYLVCKEENNGILEYLVGIYELLGVQQVLVEESLELAKIIVTDDKKTYFQCILKWKSLDIFFSLCYLYNVSGYVRNLNDARLFVGKSLIVFGMQEAGEKWLDLDELNANTIEFLCCTFTTVIGLCSKDKKIIFSHCTFRGITLDESYAEIESAYMSFNDCYIDNCIFEGIEIKYQEDRRDDDNAEISLLNLRQGRLENCQFHNCGIKAGANKNSFMQLANCKIHNCQFINCFSSYFLRSEGSFILLANCELSWCTFEKCTNDVSSHFTDRRGWWHYTSFLILAKRSATVHDNKFIHCCCDSMHTYYRNQKALIIALEDSIEMNNVFDECICPQLGKYEYRYRDTFVGDSKRC